MVLISRNTLGVRVRFFSFVTDTWIQYTGYTRRLYSRNTKKLRSHRKDFAVSTYYRSFKISPFRLPIIPVVTIAKFRSLLSSVLLNFSRGKQILDIFFCSIVLFSRFDLFSYLLPGTSHSCSRKNCTFTRHSEEYFVYLGRKISRGLFRNCTRKFQPEKRLLSRKILRNRCSLQKQYTAEW